MTQRFRKAADRELGAIVDAGHARGEEARHRRGVDDVAAEPALLHPRHEGLDAVDHALEVDAEHPVPILVGGIVDRPEQVHAGIIEEKRDRAHPRLGLVGGRGEAFARGDVEPDPGHLAIVEDGERLLDRILPDVGDHHLAALVEQHPGEAQTDAVGAAGDEGGPAREVLHAFLFRFWRSRSAAWIGLCIRKGNMDLYSSFSSRSGTAATIASARSFTPS